MPRRASPSSRFKKAKKAVADSNRESEQRYRTLAETLPQLVWTSGPDGKLDYTNGKWTEYTGRPREELLGDAWRESMHPVDREARCDFWREALKGNVPYDLEYRLRRHDGHHRWFKVRAVPLRDAQDHIVKWFGTCTDIDDQMSARRLLEESERWGRLVMESVRDFAIFTLDPAGLVNSWNSGAQAMFGYAGEEIIGRPGAVIFTAEDRAAGAPEQEIGTARRDGCSLDERWHVRKDGSRIFLSGTLRVIRDDRGELQGFTKVARDITERRHREQELHEAREALERTVAERTGQLRSSLQQLEAFSFSVSHDLRAPLRAILAYAEALRQDFAEKLDPQCHDYVRRIIDASHRLDRLVNDILLTSRTAQRDFELRPIQVRNLVEEIIHEDPRFHSPGVTIELASPLHNVMGHEPLLRQSIINLLANGVRFMPPDREPHLRLFTESNGAAVRIVVEDNGIGIAPEHVGRLFKLFERLHASEAYEGTGIGLSIVRNAAQRMGGRVGVESVLGQGSRFWIELPGVDPRLPTT